jgi:ATP-dependent protease HslVU (ClpYQ) peptidase subunit
MTTIIADREMGYMSGDRRVTSNDGEVIMTCPTKVYRVDIGGDQYLVGLAGLEGPGLIFLDWFEYGDWDEPPEPMSDLSEEDDFSALILSERGMWTVGKFMRMDEVFDRWYAIGSGGVAAWAVLMAGCGHRKAMETAIRMDSSSGGGFTTLFLDGTDEID